MRLTSKDMRTLGKDIAFVLLNVAFFVATFYFPTPADMPRWMVAVVIVVVRTLFVVNVIMIVALHVRAYRQARRMMS